MHRDIPSVLPVLEEKDGLRPLILRPASRGSPNLV